MSPTKPPLLVHSGLSDKVYIVTSYVTKPNGMVVARTKHDVTDQFLALVEAMKPATPKKGS